MKLPLGERLASALNIAFGFLFALYCFYGLWGTGMAVYAGGAIAGIIMAFNQADRNVYRKRVMSLGNEIVDLDGVVGEQVNHTEYELRFENE